MSERVVEDTGNGSAAEAPATPQRQVNGTIGVNVATLGGSTEELYDTLRTVASTVEDALVEAVKASGVVPQGGVVNLSVSTHDGVNSNNSTRNIVLDDEADAPAE